MGGKNDAPPAPNYAAAAEEQARSSTGQTLEQTFANRPTQFTPWGTTRWEYTPSSGRVPGPTLESEYKPLPGQPNTYYDPYTGDIYARATSGDNAGQFVSQGTRVDESLIEDPGEYVGAQWVQHTELDPRLQQALDSQFNLQNQRSGLASDLYGRVRDEFSPVVNFDDYISLQQAPDAPDYQGVGTGGLLGPQLYSETGMQDYGQLDTSDLTGGPTDLQRNLDYGGVNEIGDPFALRQRAEDAAYEEAASRLDPRFEQQQSDLDIQLRNQGLTPGDEAYDRAMGNFERARNDAYAQATRQAIGVGRAEADQLFGQDVTRRQIGTSERDRMADFFNRSGLDQFGMDMGFRGQRFGEMQAQANLANQIRGMQMGAEQFRTGQANQLRGQLLGERVNVADFNNRYNAREFDQGMQATAFNNQLRQQQIAEEMQRRGFTLNEINALLTGQQVGMPQMPGFNTAQRAESVQYNNAAQNQYNAGLDAFNAGQQQQQGLMSGLGGLASTALMFSDHRLKSNIRKVGQTKLFNIYEWDWNGLAVQLGLSWLPNRGVIAQEVLHVFPGAVVPAENGLLMVDYEQLNRLEERISESG